MLSFDAPLPARPARVLVAGVSGVGKTGLARRVATTLGLPYTEIDALYHGAGWVPRPQFADDVRALAAGERWVTEWQYTAARPVLAARADLLVWLDLPFFTVALPRVIRRTVRRRVTHEVLWNGNTEAPLYTFFSDRGHIVRWAWSTRNACRRSVPPLESEYPQLQLVRIRSSRQLDRWMAGPLARSAR